MRFSVPATAVTLFLTASWVHPAAAGAAQPMATPALPAKVPTSTPGTVDNSAAAAAARHAKRAACLKEAKVKKIVGADKNSYIKDCLAGH